MREAELTRRRTTEQNVMAVRSFNRFYTRQIGLLDEGLLRSPFSLTEARLLWELAQRDQSTATELRKELGLDAGYLSRLLKSFERRRLLRRTASESDGRQNLLSLTARGRETFATLDQRSRADVRAMLHARTPGEQQQLIEAMGSIERVLGEAQDGAVPGRPPASASGMESEQVPLRVPYLLRHHQPGDMGWVVHRHGLLYAQEYGWDGRFEALVARVVADFLESFDPERERCWLAERDGEVVGSVFLVQKSKTVAQLRLLLVEPSARGLGIGGRLVAECIRFATQVGYRKVTLWTNDVLVAARRIYERAGFRLVKQERHDRFGRGLVGQTWELSL